LQFAIFSLLSINKIFKLEYYIWKNLYEFIALFNKKIEYNFKLM
jgi:hypothetical protein